MRAFLSKYLFPVFLMAVLFAGKSSAQSVNSFSTDLPLIIIDTEGRTIRDGPKVMAKMKIISNANKINRFTDQPNDYNGLVGIEYRGSSSQSYPQKPYGFETRNADESNLDVSILGLPAENDWVLISNYNDKSFMRNILGFLLFSKLGHYAPRARLVDVIVNNNYQGIYILTEKIKRDKNRVNIAKLKEEDISGDALTGGYIFKIDYWNNSDSWKSPYSPINHPDYDVHFVYHDPKPKDIVSQQKKYLENYVTGFEKVLYSTYYQDELQGYPNYIDVRSFIDYFLVSEISRNNDGFKKSRYFHKDRNGKIVAGPVWDFDWAWKNINECYIFKATDGSGWAYNINDCRPDLNSPGWMIRLFYDDKFKNEVNCRYFDMRSNVLSNEAVFDTIDSLYNEVKNAQVRHFQKWDILGRNVGAPEVGEQPKTYEGEVQKLKDWIALRFSWLDNNMMGKCATVNTHELAGKVSIKIYPNPASTELHILSGKAMSSLRIFDLTGKTVYANTTMNVELAHIDVSGFSPGVYIARIIDETGNSVSEKIIIK